jgi:hypothetical protein
MSRIIAIFIVIFSASLAWCGEVGVFDPFQLKFPFTCCGVVSQHTIRSQTIDTTKRNLVIIAAGQSLGGNNAGSSYTATNAAKIDNFNIYDGVIYSAENPLLGSSSDTASDGPGNLLLRLADDLITAGLFDRVILAPIGVGGTAVAEWDTGNESDRFAVAYRRLAAKAIVPGLTNVTIIILWIQGEEGPTTTQAAYQTSLASVIAKSRTSGFSQSNVTWFVPIETHWLGAVNTGIQAAQAATVNHDANIWAGPNVDSYVGRVCGESGSLLCRQPSSDTHPTPDGAYTIAGTGGGGWRAALHAFGPPF